MPVDTDQITIPLSRIPTNSNRWALFDGIIDKEKLDAFINKHVLSCHSNYARYTFTLRPTHEWRLVCQIRCDDCLEAENISIYED